MPPNPAPNTEHTGEITNIGDKFRVVFNEQIREGEFLTVNAIHMYMLGPIAVGDLVIAQTRCRAGVTASLGEPAAAPTSAIPATTAAPATSVPPSVPADRGPSSSNVLPVAIGGGVLALGAGGAAALARRRKGGSRRTPW
jgi:hypothetical protein